MPNIHFIRADFLFLFIPLLLVLLILLKQQSKQNQWKAVCDPHLLNALTETRGKTKNRWVLVFMFLTGSLMILSMAGPSWKQQVTSSYTKKQASVIVLDMSSEMSAEDIKPSRLKRAKFKIIDLLKQMSDLQTGLIVFTSEGFLVSPLTRDKSTLTTLLNELTPDVMPIDGANISDALNKAAALIEQSGYNYGNILVLTANKALSLDLSTAKKLAQQNLHISILGMATELGAPLYDSYHRSKNTLSRLDKKSLGALANAGKGIFMPFDNNDLDIKKIAYFIKKDNAAYKKSQQSVSSWQDEGRYLLLMLLPFALTYFRRGYIESIHS